MSFRYLGPSSSFIYKDKAYKPGDMIPMTKDEVDHHEVFANHQFERSNGEPIVPSNTPIPFDPNMTPEIGEE